MEQRKRTKSLLSDYYDSLCDKQAKERYKTKLGVISGVEFSHPPDLPSSSAVASCNMEVDQQYCYCKGPDEGDMVGCDNPDCSYQWFHLACLKSEKPPSTKYWYCPDCRKVIKYKKKCNSFSTVMLYEYFYNAHYAEHIQKE